jgi:hypothetical protein
MGTVLLNTGFFFQKRVPRGQFSGRVQRLDLDDLETVRTGGFIAVRLHLFLCLRELRRIVRDFFSANKPDLC